MMRQDDQDKMERGLKKVATNGLIETQSSLETRVRLLEQRMNLLEGAVYEAKEPIKPVQVTTPVKTTPDCRQCQHKGLVVEGRSVYCNVYAMDMRWVTATDPKVSCLDFVQLVKKVTKKPKRLTYKSRVKVGDRVRLEDDGYALTKGQVYVVDEVDKADVGYNGEDPNGAPMLRAGGIWSFVWRFSKVR